MSIRTELLESPSLDEAVGIARAIVAIPEGEVADSIRRMVNDRRFSRAVRGLNTLVLDHPEHRPIAAQALMHLGLWP